MQWYTFIQAWKNWSKLHFCMHMSFYAIWKFFIFDFCTLRCVTTWKLYSQICSHIIRCHISYSSRTFIVNTSAPLKTMPCTIVWKIFFLTVLLHVRYGNDVASFPRALCIAVFLKLLPSWLKGVKIVSNYTYVKLGQQMLKVGNVNLTYLNCLEVGLFSTRNNSTR